MLDVNASGSTLLIAGSKLLTCRFIVRCVQYCDDSYSPC
jgi:hypothetical protein